MDIIRQEIRVIDYEKNEILTLPSTSESFTSYMEELFQLLMDNETIREYKTRTLKTEVVSCIKDIINKRQQNLDFTDEIDMIAKRLLLKEREAQSSIERMNKKIQKGCLIQALIATGNDSKYLYLLAKVEHTTFFDEANGFEETNGLPKGKIKLWKSCVLTLDMDVNVSEYDARVFSGDSVAKYWSDYFLELQAVRDNESNTKEAFNHLQKILNRYVPVKKYPQDNTTLRNALVSYFKTNEHFNYTEMVSSIFKNYNSDTFDEVDKVKFLNKLEELPEKKKFDLEFTTASSAIKTKIKKVYKINDDIDLTVKDAIGEDVISSFRLSTGEQYIAIKTTDQETFKSFKLREVN